MNKKKFTKLQMIKDKKKKKKKRLRSPVARSKIQQVINKIELQSDKCKKETFCRELVLPLSKTKLKKQLGQ